ncbi:MAG: hypothetical protein O2913_14375 [Chloroflexi bacterium]|nr:hypothetical protein [Chloroflexota bacterium]
MRFNANRWQQSISLPIQDQNYHPSWTGNRDRLEEILRHADVSGILCGRVHFFNMGAFIVNPITIPGTHTEVAVAGRDQP